MVFGVAVLGSVLPLFSSYYIPIQDLPQHVAAVRVLFDYSSPELGFEQYFERSLASTQYLSVYLASGFLGTVFGAALGVKLVIAAALVGLPYALRAVLRELEKPESYALLSVPLAYNAHLILGFINFLAALPLLFWGVFLALRLRRAWTVPGAIGLGAVALACFYTHLVPYAVLILSSAAVLLRREPKASLRSLATLVPSLLALLVWFFTNPVGRKISALAEETDGSGPSFLSSTEALRELPEWFTDVFHTRADEQALIAWILVMLALFTVGSAASHPSPPPLESVRRRIAWIVPLAFSGYWLMPASYDFIWPIHARFVWIAVLFAILAAPRVSPTGRVWIALFALTLSAWSSSIAWRAFRDAGDLEYRGLSSVIARVPQGSRVAGLIYDRSSSIVRFAPYLHAVAWIQAERGGAVQFSFAEFPHSPFRFRPDNRPPPVAPRWEWTPQRVDVQRDLAWFDYILTRGGRPLAGFRRIAGEGLWTLWGR